MTIKEVYAEFLAELKGLYNAGEAAAITNIIFDYFGGMSSTAVITNANNELDNHLVKLLQNALMQIKKHVPVQYITGKAWFYNVSFKVNKNVLIPRAETEELVLEAINFLKENEGKKVIDIGTGSGCIPISIKKNISEADVTAIDVSKEALAVAKNNALSNNVKIKFLELDFLDENNYGDLPKFDLIISNPPSIPENEKKSLDKNVKDYEPHLALFVPDNDPLLFYKKILVFAENHLKINGKILLETHEDFAKQTAAIFIANKYEVEIKKDMQDKERMLLIYHYP